MKRRRVLVSVALGTAALLGAGGWWFQSERGDPDYDDRIEVGDSSMDASAWVGSDDRTVLISTVGGACDKRVDVKVREGVDTVKIAVTVRVAGGMCILPAFNRGYKVVLHESLGDRELLAIDDIAYPRIVDRPQESSYNGREEVPVKVEFD